MRLKVKTIKDVMFYVAIFMMQFALFAQNITFVKPHVQQCLNTSNIILVISLFYTLISQKASIKKWIIIFTLLCLSLISSVITNDTLLITLITSTILTFDMDFKNITKKDIYFKIALFGFILLMYNTKNVNYYIFTRDGQIRYSLGFNHPNYLGYFSLILYFEIIYYKGMLEKKKDIILFIFLNIIVFYLTNLAHSRTSQICIVIFNMLYIFQHIKKRFLNLNKKNHKNRFIFYILTFAFLTFLSFYITKLYKNGNSFAIYLNELLSKRLIIQQKFIDNNNITIFGKELFFYTTLDNTYIHLLLNFGVIIWGLYGFIYAKMLQKCDETDNNILKICIIVIMIYGLMEWYMIRPLINIFLLYIGTVLFSNKGVVKK